MAHLHQDIVLDIIVRLPVKSILRFRCVSKAWCKLFKDPDFVKKHLIHANEMNRFSVMMLSGEVLPGFGYRYIEDTYTLAYDPSLFTLGNRVHINYPPKKERFGISVWGTCNGLVCLSSGYYENAVLWNPATKEFKEIPAVPMDESEYKFLYCQYAFGYDDKIDDFKVVSFVGYEDETLCEVHIYTLKSNSWRRLEDIPWNICSGDLIMTQVSVNGAAHWLASPDYKIGSTDPKPDDFIASFDFKDERFDTFPLPRFCGEYAETHFCSLRGSLCLHGSIGGRVDVWEMKEYGLTESWAKLFTVNQDTIFEYSRQLAPLQFVKNDEVLLGYPTDVDYHLDLYDIKLGTSTNLKSYAIQDSYFATTFAYEESLVPLNSGTFVGLPKIEDSKASAKPIDADTINSGAHVGGIDRGDSEDDDNESEEKEEELAEGFSLRPMDKYNCYVEQYMDLKRRKVDLETRKLDLETRRLNLEIRAQEDRHMSMDISKMHAIQLKWWHMRANEIVENCKTDDNDGNLEDEGCNDVELEEDMQCRKKKARLM